MARREGPQIELEAAEVKYVELLTSSDQRMSDGGRCFDDEATRRWFGRTEEVTLRLDWQSGRRCADGGGGGGVSWCKRRWIQKIRGSE